MDTFYLWCVLGKIREDTKMTDVICPPKEGFYGFNWRVIFEDMMYELQRYSPEYRTWFTVQASRELDPIRDTYNRIEK